MLNYLFEVSLCWAGFYGLYALLLSKTTFFGTNRLYLFSTLLLGLLIPLAPLPEWSPEPVAVTQYLQPIQIGVQQMESTVSALPASDGVPWGSVLLGLYGLGVVFYLTRLGVGLAKILALYRHGDKEPYPGFRLIRTQKAHLPFSFFNLLFISRKIDLDEEEWKTVMRHEKAHIRGMHSLDVLVTELLCSLFWCVPLVYLYRRSLRHIHEYLADRAALETMRAKRYGHMLLRQSQFDLQLAFANNLIQSSLKKRIIMMTRHQSSRHALLRYALLLPLMVLFLLAFANRSLIGQTLLEIRKADGSIEQIQVDPENMPDDLFDPNSIESVDVKKEENRIIVRLKEISAGSETRVEGENPVNAAVREKVGVKIRQMAEPDVSGATRETAIQGDPVIRVHYPDGSVREGRKGDGLLEGIDPESIATINVSKPKDGSDDLIEVVLKGAPRTEAPAEGLKLKSSAVRMPRFPGCEEGDLDSKSRNLCATKKMSGFLMSELRYPESARKQEVEGMVVVEFTVGQDGAILSPKVLKSLSPDCDAEALRVVRAMPDWIPGEKEGEPVAVSMKLPFNFALPASNAKSAPEPKSGQLELGDFSLAPNPSSGQVRVRFSATAQPTRLVISDLQGRALMTKDLDDFDGYYDQQLDLDRFAAGPLVLVISQGEQVFTRRIVLEE